MSRIELPKPLRDSLARGLSRYLKTELDLDVTGFDAHFLLDHIAETLGRTSITRACMTPRPS